MPRTRSSYPLYAATARRATAPKNNSLPIASYTGIRATKTLWLTWRAALAARSFNDGTPWSITWASTLVPGTLPARTARRGSPSALIAKLMSGTLTSSSANSPARRGDAASDLPGDGSGTSTWRRSINKNGIWSVRCARPPSVIRWTTRSTCWRTPRSSRSAVPYAGRCSVLRRTGTCTCSCTVSARRTSAPCAGRAICGGSSWSVTVPPVATKMRILCDRNRSSVPS